MNEITQMLDEIQAGKPLSGELFAAVYGELRAIAADKLSHERADHTLQPTALVNEAYMRLFGGSSEPSWENRAHFFGAAAEAMRRVLVDYARKRQAKKRGGEAAREQLLADPEVDMPPPDEILDVDWALNRLAESEPEKAELVKLRYFGGLGMEEIAKCLSISIATAQRHWAYARAWLAREIEKESPLARNP